MLAEKLVVNLPAERVYPSLLDYLKNHPIEETEVVRSEPSYIEVKKRGLLMADFVKIDILPQDDKSEILIDFNFTGYIIPWVLYELFWITIFASLRKPLGYLSTFWLFFPILATANYIIKLRKSFKDKISDYFLGMERATSPDQES